MYDFPGNIRELENEVKRAAALAEPGSFINPELLSDRVRGHQKEIDWLLNKEGKLSETKLPFLRRSKVSNPAPAKGLFISEIFIPPPAFTRFERGANRDPSGHKTLSSTKQADLPLAEPAYRRSSEVMARNMLFYSDNGW